MVESQVRPFLGFFTESYGKLEFKEFQGARKEVQNKGVSNYMYQESNVNSSFQVYCTYSIGIDILKIVWNESLEIYLRKNDNLPRMRGVSLNKLRIMWDI